MSNQYPSQQARSAEAWGLVPDRYLVGASWPAMRSGDGTTGWWITSIRIGDRELGDAPIAVDPNTNVGDVTIAFSDRIGTIEGTLTDAAGRPAPEYFVLAFPVERASWTTVSRRIIAPARPGTDGHLPGVDCRERDQDLYRERGDQAM